jgi:hypothetical protein
MKGRIKDFLLISVNIVLFAMSVTAIFTFMVSLYNYTSNVQDACYYNTTVVKTMPENTMYNGYVVDGKIVYDGELDGKQVYTDVLNGTDTNIVIKNNRVHDLNAELYNDQNLLSYARSDDPTILLSENVINIDATYLRKYLRDTSGNVTQIIYEKQ